ncbi:MAG: cobaltochelatase subunit CobS [Micavibrio sp.]|nr:cobaltochelatase subunit CobS [Micavibrio sp.]|tara:strand:- start:159976 stop:161001 length:1026 start_codon:yes stop_codon:yes gene_type:complete
MSKNDNEPIAASFDVTQLQTTGKYKSIPDTKFSVNETFGLDLKEDFQVPGFLDDTTPNIPAIDPTYQFDKDTTLAILAGFSHNRRVMVQGYHGTGKSTHIEQVAARLNWPCVRINLDSHVSRLDLLGKDMIVLREGKQITEYKQGLLPWALQNPVALVFDEYDAGRPDVMFVIQRVLEAEGRLTLLDQNVVIRPHPAFRLFATSNTVGLGDTTGLYHGTQQLNQGQMDRWNIVSVLNYLPAEDEIGIMLSKNPDLNNAEGKAEVAAMVQLANLIRNGFKNGDLSIVMSPRTVLSWIENTRIFKDREMAFELSFLNKCDTLEHAIIAEYYQRCFGVDILKDG